MPKVQDCGQKSRAARLQIDAYRQVESSSDCAGILRVVNPSQGYRRRRVGKRFVFLDRAGKVIRRPNVIARIQSLVIPPAWKDVWISTNPQSHLQAFGTDARGRKQYRYHPKWRSSREQAKFEKLLHFLSVLPRIRRCIRGDLRLNGMRREKVLAAVIRLLETTYIRVGNSRYKRENGSSGLTTLDNDQVRVRGPKIHFDFTGKSGVHHEIDLRDPELATIIRRCQNLPGEELFCYVDDDGVTHDVTSADVNQYLHRISHAEITAKDFRTWAGSLLVCRMLRSIGPAATMTQCKKNLIRAFDSAAECLGNTRSVCRSSYVHPAIVTAYSDGTLDSKLQSTAGHVPAGLKQEERALVQLLRSAAKAG